ncbi:MAG: hypothetical protein ABSF08_06885, partial [Candidatus Cybelea sp.]
LAAASFAAAFLAACGASSGLPSMPSSVGSVRAPHRHKQTFKYTGYEQTFVVPSYVTNVTIRAYGASGGGGGYSDFPAGGQGGVVKATIRVSPGESLAVLVGGEGTNESGGYNGGGGPGYCLHRCNAAQTNRVRPDNDYYAYPAYGGGGASDVRQGGDALADRVVVAAGGGGAGGTIDQCYHGCKEQYYSYGGTGGGGGGLSGDAGGGGSTSSSSGSGIEGEGGGGGSQSGGGTGGAGGFESFGSGSSCDGSEGSSGKQGVGGSGAGSCDEPAGGGGGGYYGAGGGGSSAASFYCSYGSYQISGDSQYCGADFGGGGGGGGGSSFVEQGAKHVKNRGGDAPAGNGEIVISW